MTAVPTVRVVAGAATADRAVRAVGNLLTASDLPVTVELVCYGPGIDLALAGGAAAERVRQLQERGVTVLACANSLTGRGLTAEALLPGVEIVKAAVWHLVRRQHEGWAYIPV